MSNQENRKVYVLYGVALRDPNELVCMFFDRKAEMKEFREELPGRYRCLVLTGLHTPIEDIDFEDLYKDTRTFGLPS